MTPVGQRLNRLEDIGQVRPHVEVYGRGRTFICPLHPICGGPCSIGRWSSQGPCGRPCRRDCSHPDNGPDGYHNCYGHQQPGTYRRRSSLVRDVGVLESDSNDESDPLPPAPSFYQAYMAVRSKAGNERTQYFTVTPRAGEEPTSDHPSLDGSEDEGDDDMDEDYDEGEEEEEEEREEDPEEDGATVPSSWEFAGSEPASTAEVRKPHPSP